ncbi:MAG TPA: type II toxin-antitoxin system PemK/MazF family toxin [Acidimicrobiia bacterium]|nr:type II toxin-antitoxin system PemK/MazF family toxin [Acidimicrobiia bacterium]
MRRAEVWWAERPPGQRHPVLLLSWDAHGDWRDRVTVADVTTRARGLDAEVALGVPDGMPRACVVNLDNLATVPRSILRSRITTLSPARMAEVSRAVHLALGLPLPCTMA